MPEILTSARRVVLFYKMAIARFCLFVLGTLCASIQTALAGAVWEAMSHQQKFLIVVGIVGSVASTIGAFFDKTLTRLSGAADGAPATATVSTAPFIAPDVKTGVDMR